MNKLSNINYFKGILVIVFSFLFIFPFSSHAFISFPNKIDTKQERINIQTVLNQVMFPSPNLKTDGVLGRKSIQAVQAFQESHGLISDGKVGAITRLALESAQTGTYTNITTSSIPGCLSGAFFNTLNGQPCSSVSTSGLLPRGCTSTFGFSTLTGASCSTQSTPIPVRGGGGSSGGGGGGGSSTSSDTTNPVVSLTSPLNNTTVSGTITISATATDNIAISKVDFYKDNDITPFDSKISSYTTSLNTAILTNGTHTFKAIAYDTKGNTTTSSIITTTVSNIVVTLLPAVNPSNTVQGLDYKYYEGTSYTVLPNFPTLTPVKTGTTTDFDITLADRPEVFSFNFTGYVTVPTDGDYIFYTSSDDGSRIYIDDILIVNNDGLHDLIEQSGTIGLRAGKHAISTQYFNQLGGKSLSVRYAGPGITKQLIPTASLFRVNIPDVTKPVIASFTVPATATSTTVSIATFTATDNISVTGYKLTESATAPLSGDSGWTVSAPTTYTFASEGSKTLYAWVKDQAGNVSLSVSDTVTITITASNTFYVSYSTGLDTNDGTSPSTPWKTIAKVNSQTFTPGASILFKKGDTWTGETITINSSGNSSNPITYSSYSTGSNPVISGFTTISGWTNEGSGIYSKVISPQSSPNMVTVNGVNKPIGRWPNTGTTNGGYLTIDSHVGRTSITDNDLASSPNWTGADLVIRKNRYIIDRNLITNHSGNTISYNLTYPVGTYYDAIDGYGYFIENDLKTLDQTGEWYYNSGTGKFYMYFAGNNPTSYTVKVSTINENVNSSAKSYITIDGLDFEGANTTAIRIAAATAASHTIINNCNINNSGFDGIKADGGTSYLTINNSVINNTNNHAIYMVGWAGVATTGVITNNYISNTGMIPGMGNSDDGYNSILVSLDNSLIENNVVDMTGFNGIKFVGERSNITVRNNFINNSCQIKDDCSGIYITTKTYNNHLSHHVENNIVLNSLGNHDGVSVAHTAVVSHGIYLDDSTENTEVVNNTAANNQGGGFFLGYANKNNILTGNISYNNKYQLWTIRSTGIIDPADIITGNVFFAKDLSKYLVYIDNSNPALLGTVDNNYYERPLNDNNVFWLSYPSYHYENLTEWKANHNIDANSHTSPVTITDPNDILFDYNATTGNKTVSLGSNTYVDVTGATKTGSVTLLPYTSIILIRTNVLGVSTYHFTKDLKLGSRGNEVKELQKILISSNYLSGIPDGIYGNLTKQAVIKYQIAHNINPLGIVGHMTRGELNK
ncbi:MAG: peptidoglycan-binding protein [Candidatus Paceibacterota bacterium]